MRIASMGHAVFAAVMTALGILCLVKGDFMPIWDGVPKGMPAREVLVHVCVLVSLACGIGLLWQRTAAPAARVLLIYLLLWMLAFKVRYIILAPMQELSYQSWGATAVIVAGAWVLYTWFATDWDRKHLGFATGKMGLRIARVFYGLALIAFGLSHFYYLNFTAPLVPDWLPWHVGWAYFTGIAYLAAGLAVLVNVYARLAAALSALQMGMFLLLIWIPLAVAGRLTAFQWGELVATCVLTASAWVVADSWRGTPWLSIGKSSRAVVNPGDKAVAR